MTPKQTLLVLASFTFLAACGGANTSGARGAGEGAPAGGAGHGSPIAPADDGPMFRFGWGLPCRVPITTASSKKGGTYRYQFFLDVKRVGDKVHARFEGMRVLEIDGQDLTTPAMQRKAAAAVALMNLMPTLEVSQDGEFERAIGVEELVDRIIALDPRNEDPKRRAAVTAVMKNPAMIATIEDGGGDYWRSWVGAWIDFGAQPDMPLDVDTEASAFGVFVPMHVKAEHLGASLQYEGAAHLRITSTIDGDKSPEALEKIVTNILGQPAPDGTSLPKPTVKRFEKVTSFDAHTDPATLRPTRVLVRTTMHVDTDSGSKTTLESREDTFDWKNATGCSKGH